MDKLRTEGERTSSTLDDKKEYLIVDDNDFVVGAESEDNEEYNENNPLGGSLELYDIERDHED